MAEGDGIGDKGSGDNTTVDAETFYEAFGHISEIYLCKTAFPWQKAKFLVLDYTQVPDYQDCQPIR